MDENVWSKQESDGVTFEVEIADPENNSTSIIFSKILNPAHNIEDRGWLHYDIKLEKYQNKNVNISFITKPNQSDEYDWAWWGNPQITL